MRLEQHPYYWPDDSLHPLHLAGGHFYLRLSNTSLPNTLRALLAEAGGYERYLTEYPSVLCQPLDLFYVLRRASSSLDEELLQDLLFSFSWREANWGAFLAALAPNRSYLEHLLIRRHSLPHGTVILDMAVHSCGGDCSSSVDEELMIQLGDIRTLLASLPPMKYPMRGYPSLDELATINREIESLRQAYRTHGALGVSRSQWPMLANWFNRR